MGEGVFPGTGAKSRRLRGARLVGLDLFLIPHRKPVPECAVDVKEKSNKIRLQNSIMLILHRGKCL